MAASRRISPAWFMPISMMPTRQASGRRSRDSGTPTWLLKLPVVLPVGNSVSNRCAMASLVVVLPALPVTATMRPPHFWRAHEARAWRACPVSGTRRVGQASACQSERSSDPPGGLAGESACPTWTGREACPTTTAAAPFSAAADRKWSPPLVGQRGSPALPLPPRRLFRRRRPENRAHRGWGRVAQSIHRRDFVSVYPRSNRLLPGAAGGSRRPSRAQLLEGSESWLTGPCDTHTP